MMNLNYQIAHILCQIFKIILNIIKKHKILTTIFPIHVCINKTNNRLAFKIKKWI